MSKWARMFDKTTSFTITDIPKLSLLDFEEEGVQVNANAQEMNGTDGVILGGRTTFGSFKLILRFWYKGNDTDDYNLMKQRLRGLLFKRDPYYISHSDMPGKKYAVYCEENAITDVGTQFGQFEVTFVVYKGYSESLKDTQSLNLMSDFWQYGNGLTASEDTKYTHNTNKFKIFNGSTDTIEPAMNRHDLEISINIDAPNGFKLVNKTNKTEFEYTKKLTTKDTLIIKGANPFINNKRVGHNTTFEYVTIAEGYNDFEIQGDGAILKEIKFKFPFIYR